MAEDTGAPPPAERSQAADFGRGVLRWLGWLARLAVGLVWTAVYLALRLLEGSKRVLACIGFLTAACLTIVWVLLALRDLPLWAILGVIIGVIWAVSSEQAWQELRARMEFIAESHPDTRLLHADGELRRLMRGGQVSWHGFARLALAVLLAVLVVTGWQEMTLNLRAMAVSFLAAVSGIIFFATGWAFWQIEQRLRVRFYVKGWRLADPAALELSALARWPKLEGVLGWRPAIASRLARLSPAVRAWLQPWGVCAE